MSWLSDLLGTTKDTFSINGNSTAKKYTITTAGLSSNKSNDAADIDDAIAKKHAVYAHPNHSGDVTSVADGAQTIANKAVTLAKMADMATASLLYRKTAEAGAPEVNSLATLKTDLGLTGTNSGDNAANTSIVATKLDDFATPDNNTDLNANTTNHGLLLAAVAPASPLTNIVAIENGETVYKLKALFDTTHPEALGTAAEGSAATAARRDHVHTLPKLDDLASPDANTDLNATTTAHGLLLAATAPASGLRNVVGIDNAESAYTNKALFDATSPSTQAYGDAAVVGTAMTAARRDHIHAMPAAYSLADEAVTNAKLAHIATSTIKGRVAAGTGDVEDLSAANVRTIINVADGANNYTHPTGDGNLHVPANSTTNSGKVLTAGAAAGTYTWEAASSGGGLTWSLITADPSPAVKNNGYMCNTTGGAFTVTLPAAPTAGDIISFTDAAGTFDTLNLTIGKNSLNIMGLAADMTVSTKYAAFSLVYASAALGWRIA